MFVKQNDEELLLCTLTHKYPQQAVNMYVEISEPVEFLVRGNGAVHLIGFYEPEPHFEPLDEVELHHKHEREGHEHEGPKEGHGTKDSTKSKQKVEKKANGAHPPAAPQVE